MNILSQFLVLFAVCLFGEGIAAVLPFPFPASVISMIVLFLLFMSGILRPQHIKESSGFLLDNMALFFIPAGVGILRYSSVLKESLTAILLICFITTPIIYAVTGWTVQLSMRLINKKEEKKRD